MKKYFAIFGLSILSCYMIGCTADSKSNDDNEINKKIDNGALICTGKDSSDNKVIDEITFVNGRVTNVVITTYYFDEAEAISNSKVIEKSIGNDEIIVNDNILSYRSYYDRLKELTYDEVITTLNNEKEDYHWECK